MVLYTLGFISGGLVFYLTVSWLAFQAMYSKSEDKPHWLFGLITSLYVLISEMKQIRI